MRHHEEAIERFVDRARRRPEVLGVIITGSVARGAERADSDVDVVLVVTETAWAAALTEQRIMVVETEGAEYDHGYFDVKLATTAMLDAAALRGDEPVLDSLANARVALDQGFDLDLKLTAVRAATMRPTPGLVDSFVAQAALHGEYFLPGGLRDGDPLLTAHAAVHLATSACRAALAVAGIPFAGPKQLLAATAALGGASAELALAAVAVAVVERPSERAAGRVLELLAEVAGPPPGMDATLSRFVLDNELAWFTGRSAPEYR